MFDLPLIPLQTVLFPGASLNAQIVEKRYQQVLSWCAVHDQPFGAVLSARSGIRNEWHDAPHRIGCIARVTELRRGTEGRMQLSAVGLERFRILSIQKDRTSNWLGCVETFPLVKPLPYALSCASHELRQLINRFHNLSGELAVPHHTHEAPSGHPIGLAYRAAADLEMPADQKQELLSCGHASDFFEVLNGLYRREVVALQALLGERREEAGVFSTN